MQCYINAIFTQGTLEVRDGDFGDSKLRLDIEKSAPTDEALKFITVNHTIFNIEKGNVYVLQIVSINSKECNN